MKNLCLVENGNTETKINEESLHAFKRIQEQAENTHFDIKELKTINYIRKSVEGYSNNVLRKAYSYYDKMNNDLYLYIPQRNRMQILSDLVFVKNIKHIP